MTANKSIESNYVNRLPLRISRTPDKNVEELLIATKETEKISSAP